MQVNKPKQRMCVERYEFLSFQRIKENKWTKQSYKYKNQVHNNI